MMPVFFLCFIFSHVFGCGNYYGYTYKNCYGLKNCSYPCRLYGGSCILDGCSSLTKCVGQNCNIYGGCCGYCNQKKPCSQRSVSECGSDCVLVNRLGAKSFSNCLSILGFGCSYNNYYCAEECPKNYLKYAGVCKQSCSNRSKGNCGSECYSSNDGCVDQCPKDSPANIYRECKPLCTGRRYPDCGSDCFQVENGSTGYCADKCPANSSVYLGKKCKVSCGNRTATPSECGSDCVIIINESTRAQKCAATCPAHHVEENNRTCRNLTCGERRPSNMTLSNRCGAECYLNNGTCVDNCPRFTANKTGECKNVSCSDRTPENKIVNGKVQPYCSLEIDVKACVFDDATGKCSTGCSGSFMVKAVDLNENIQVCQLVECNLRNMTIISGKKTCGPDCTYTGVGSTCGTACPEPASFYNKTQTSTFQNSTICVEVKCENRTYINATTKCRISSTDPCFAVLKDGRYSCVGKCNSATEDLVDGECVLKKCNASSDPNCEPSCGHNEEQVDNICEALPCHLRIPNGELIKRCEMNGDTEKCYAVADTVGAGEETTFSNYGSCATQCPSGRVVDEAAGTCGPESCAAKNPPCWEEVWRGGCVEENNVCQVNCSTNKKIVNGVCTLKECQERKPVNGSCGENCVVQPDNTSCNTTCPFEKAVYELVNGSSCKLLECSARRWVQTADPDGKDICFTPDCLRVRPNELSPGEECALAAAQRCEDYKDIVQCACALFNGKKSCIWNITGHFCMDLKCPCKNQTTTLGSSIDIRGSTGFSSNDDDEEEEGGAWGATACNHNVNRSASFRCEIGASTEGTEEGCYLDPNKNNDCTTLCAGFPLWIGNKETHKCELPTDCSARVPNPYLLFPCGTPDCFYSNVGGIRECSTVPCPPFSVRDNSTGRCVWQEECRDRVPVVTLTSNYSCGSDCVYDPLVEQCRSECSSPDHYEKDEETGVCKAMNCYRRIPLSDEEGARKGGVCGEGCAAFGPACIKEEVGAGNGDPGDKGKGGDKAAVPVWIFLVVIGAVVAVGCVAVIATVVLVRRHRKKKRARKIEEKNSNYVESEASSEASSAVTMSDLSYASVNASDTSVRMYDSDNESVKGSPQRKSPRSRKSKSPTIKTPRSHRSRSPTSQSPRSHRSRSPTSKSPRSRKSKKAPIPVHTKTGSLSGIKAVKSSGEGYGNETGSKKRKYSEGDGGKTNRSRSRSKSPSGSKGSSSPKKKGEKKKKSGSGLKKVSN